jgi:hypothetical protein
VDALRRCVIRLELQVGRNALATRKVMTKRILNPTRPLLCRSTRPRGLTYSLEVDAQGLALLSKLAPRVRSSARTASTASLVRIPSDMVVSSTGQRPRIFLSHSSADRKWVSVVASICGETGVDVYLAEQDPQPGRVLAEKVTEEIERSDAMVVLLTANSIRSVWVQQEIGIARTAGIDLIPILVDTSGPGEADLGVLAGVEILHIHPDSPRDGLSALVAVLTRMVNETRIRALADAQRKQNRDALVFAGIVLVVVVLISNAGNVA